jgi:hypothetical protein
VQGERRTNAIDCSATHVRGFVVAHAFGLGRHLIWMWKFASTSLILKFNGSTSSFLLQLRIAFVSQALPCAAPDWFTWLHPHVFSREVIVIYQ